MRAAAPTIAFACTLAAAGCITPEPDRPGEGSVPEIAGTIEGTVLYVGQRPECDAEGVPRGNVILLLFLADDPPPPSGNATSAENLLVVSGRDLFQPSDCLPAEPSPDELRQVVTRSADFVWPEIALARGEGASVEYQIRGFYDRDGDFNPFFSVRRLATRGDVAGGAFVNTAEDPPQFARIRFGSVDDEGVGQTGQVVRGVAVTLAAVVNTELPVSRLGEGTRALSSEAVIPPTSDPVMREQLLWDHARMRLSLIDPSSQSWSATLEAAGMSIDPHPSGYGWFVLPVDANRDGEQDPHPTLGAGGVMWEHPIVVLRRARNPIELAAGIPDAVIVASVRATQTFAKDTFAPDIDIVVPPIAAVTLDPSRPECRVPYVAPGNLAETYEGIPVDCQELPTGNYDVNVLAGIAGGRAVNYRDQLRESMPEISDEMLDALVAARTDTDWVIEGGSYSSQAWSIPNELGCPDPIYRPNALDEDGNPIAVSQLDPDPFANCGPPEGPCDATGTRMQCTQGPAGRFSVVDPEPDNNPAGPDHGPGHGVASCRTAIRASTMMPDTVEYVDVPEACCAAIAHLCDLPLCPLRPAAALAHGDARGIRELRVPDVDYRREEDGTITPLCVPFLMPASCCE